MPSLASRWSGRAGTVGFVLAALALARVVGDNTPDPSERYGAPHEIQAVYGEPAQLRTATITVESLSLSEQLLGTSDVIPTEGIWVVVNLSYTPQLTQTGLSYAELTDTQGRSFTQTRRAANTCRISFPGIPMHCAIGLELPAEAAPGSVLRLATNPDDQRFDDILVLDLGIDAEMVESAQESGETLVLRDPVVDGW